MYQDQLNTSHSTQVHLNLNWTNLYNPSLYCPAQYINYITGRHTAWVILVGQALSAGQARATRLTRSDFRLHLVKFTIYKSCNFAWVELPVARGKYQNQLNLYRQFKSYELDFTYSSSSYSPLPRTLLLLLLLLPILLDPCIYTCLQFSNLIKHMPEQNNCLGLFCKVPLQQSKGMQIRQKIIKNSRKLNQFNIRSGHFDICKEFWHYLNRFGGRVWSNPSLWYKLITCAARLSIFVFLKEALFISRVSSEQKFLLKFRIFSRKWILFCERNQKQNVDFRGKKKYASISQKIANNFHYIFAK